MELTAAHTWSARRFRAASRIPLLALALTLLCTAPGHAVKISWKAVRNHGTPISLLRNSHATAGASLAKYHGLHKSGEKDSTLVATMWVYMQHCECDKPGKPTVWRIAEGLQNFFTARGRPNTAIKQRCRYSSNASERATLDDYVSAINGNRPVVLTFCCDPSASSSLAAAKRRVSNCFSVLGIGYMTYGDQKFLICHDGISSAEAASPAAPDRVSAKSLGLNTQGKPWGQSGTALYKWDGAYKNLVMVFVGG